MDDVTTPVSKGQTCRTARTKRATRTRNSQAMGRERHHPWSRAWVWQDPGDDSLQIVICQ